MEGGRDTELDAALPHRVVVVQAVDAERVEPARGAVLEPGTGRSSGPPNMNASRPSPGRVLELGERLLGRVHRDDPDRCQLGAVIAELLGVEGVERVRDGAAQVAVVEIRGHEAVGRVEDGVVDADLVEPLREQRGQERRAAVERVARRKSPPRRAHERLRAHLLAREVAHQAARRGDEVEPGHRGVAGLLAQDVAHDGQVLDQVPVRVDDRMVDPRADLFDVHDFPPMRHPTPPCNRMCGPSSAAASRPPDARSSARARRRPRSISRKATATSRTCCAPRSS